MKMQDNEMDDLFRSKLDDFETQPSPRIWEHIEAELDNTRKRKVWISILSIAASIIMLFSIVVILIPFNKGERKSNGVVYSTNNRYQNNLNTAPIIDKHLKEQTIVKVQEPKNIKGGRILKNTNYNNITIITREKITPETINNRDSTRVSQDELTIAYSNKVSKMNNVVPDSNTKFINVPSILVNNNLELNASKINQPDNHVTNKPIKAPKAKIRNLGGLINALVAKVDKRKDKFIEFTETDEGSNITALNLGVFKIKKPKAEIDK
jgi:lipopolysaccharide export LptBFGC system permease protein LptF